MRKCFEEVAHSPYACICVTISSKYAHSWTIFFFTDLVNNSRLAQPKKDLIYSRPSLFKINILLKLYFQSTTFIELDRDTMRHRVENERKKNYAHELKDNTIIHVLDKVGH